MFHLIQEELSEKSEFSKNKRDNTTILRTMVVYESYEKNKTGRGTSRMAQILCVEKLIERFGREERGIGKNIFSK